MSFVTGMSYSLFAVSGKYPSHNRCLDDKRGKRGRTKGGREEEGKKWKRKETPRLVLDLDHDFFSQLRSYDLR